MAWPFTRRQPKPLTAAAVPYATPRPVATGTDAITVRKPKEWQKEAGDYFDLIWLVKKGLTVHADLVARCDLYVGFEVGDDDERPAEVMAEALREVVPNPDGTPGRPNALTAAQAQIAVDELDRLQASQGGQAAILHDLDLNTQIAGECSLVGFPVDDPLGLLDEDWTVLSMQEFKQAPSDDSGPRYSRIGPTGKWEPMPPGTFAMRVWRPHPVRSWEPDSPLLGVLSNCETLTISERMIQAQMKNRTSAGVWLFPQEATKGPPDPTRSEQDGQTEDPTVASVEEAFLDPISDPGAPGAVAPTLIVMLSEYIAAAKEGWLTFDRPMDEVAVQYRTEAKSAVIEALPLPPEVLAGLGDSTYRNAERITQNVFDQHVRPDVEFLCASLTSGLLRRAWRIAGLPVDLVNRLVVWYDPSGLIAQPDQMDNSKAAYEEGLIGPGRRRHDLRYSDADAPTEEEKAEMAEWLRLRRGLPAEDSTLPPDGNADPVVAAVNASRADRLATAGRRLAAIDRDTQVKLLAFCDALLTAALTRAGNRALSSMPRSVAASHMGSPRDTLVAALGADYVQNDLSMTDAELLANAFADLDGRYLAWTTDAQRKALRVVAGVTGLSVEDQERLVEEGEERRLAGLAVLSAGLLDLARARLYDPHPAAPPRGEHDASMRVPAGLVREALAVSGGVEKTQRTDTGGVLDEEGNPVGGVANGPDVMAIFQASGIVTNGWVWEHGDPSQPFPPHEALDGVEFDTWDDPVLIPSGEADWLDGDYMRPGDHAGCQCGFSRRLAYEDDTAEDAA